MFTVASHQDSGVLTPLWKFIFFILENISEDYVKGFMFHTVTFIVAQWRYSVNIGIVGGYFTYNMKGRESTFQGQNSKSCSYCTQRSQKNYRDQKKTLTNGKLTDKAENNKKIWIKQKGLFLIWFITNQKSFKIEVSNFSLITIILLQNYLATIQCFIDVVCQLFFAYLWSSKLFN